VDRGTITTATVCCVNAAGCCAAPVVIYRTARAVEELNFGNRQDYFLKLKSEKYYVSKEHNFTIYV
jgi:hypothetical protein